ncbi:hypothetical protein PS870_06571 [Pseudomonas fluorescens]|uniref:Uncharacterized protein n=1 Tax=Pseudomonas fluorescens TaxID=294 RepID=A0A5E7QKR7_PSEFL|nr:hypothetical protein PS870_06571 [Pseudomonas fluorescens]
MRLTFLGSSEIDVLEDDFDTGRSADKRDARAHHSGAEHTDFPGFIGRKTLRSGTAVVDFVQLEPKRADQVFRNLPGRQLGEVAGFDQVRGVEIDLSALHRRA